MVLLYNLTSDEQYAPVIGLRLGLLSAGAERTDSPAIQRRLRTLITNVHRLLKVKPAVDGLLVRIFHQPIIGTRTRWPGSTTPATPRRSARRDSIASCSTRCASGCWAWSATAFSA